MSVGSDCVAIDTFGMELLFWPMPVSVEFSFGAVEPYEWFLRGMSDERSSVIFYARWTPYVLAQKYLKNQFKFYYLMNQANNYPIDEEMKWRTRYSLNPMKEREQL